MPIEPVIQESQNDTVRALVRALDLHGPGEGGHAERVAVYAVATAEAMDLPDEDLLTLRRAGALHDVGKISVDPGLLRKLGRLTDEELDALKLHAEMAIRLVESFPFLRATIPIIRHHHERWDGTGYPDGLRGEAIPLGARIVGVAEAYDALTQESGWREPMTEAEAIAELRRCAGTQFDPAVVEAFAGIQPLVQPVAWAEGGRG